LTNAHKHAPGLPVLVRLAGSPQAGVRVSVENPLSPDTRSAPGNRSGIQALATRVQLLGGQLEAGVDEGAFLVSAVLPWTVATSGAVRHTD